MKNFCSILSPFAPLRLCVKPLLVFLLPLAALLFALCGAPMRAQQTTVLVDATTGEIKRPTASTFRTANDIAQASALNATNLTTGTVPNARLDSDLQLYAAITPSANVQTFLGAADYSAMRTQLGLVIGTNVQAYDADLTTWSGITPGTGVATALAATANAATGLITGTGSATLDNKDLTGSGNTYRTATTSTRGGLILATTAEALAGTDTAKALTPATNEARALLGDFTRQIRDSLYSDGVTSSRRAEWTPGTAGAVAGLPVSIPFEFDVPTSNPSAVSFIIYFGNSVTTAATSWAFYGQLTTAGELQFAQRGATAGSDFRALVYSGFRSAYSGLRVRGMIVFASPDTTTAPAIYLQGADASASFSASSGGSAPNWMPSSLATTYYLNSYIGAAGRFQPHAPILGALTAAEVLDWTQTGRLPTWCEVGTGSAVASVTNDGSSAGNFVNTGGNAGAAFDVNTTVAGKIYFLLQATGNSWFANTPALSGEPIGKRFGFTIKARLRSGTAVPIIVGSDLTSSQVTSFTPTGTETVFTGTFTNNGGILRIGTPGAANGSSYEFDDFAMWPLGPIFKPVIQPIAVLADTGTNKIAGILTSGITPITEKRDWVIQGSTNTNGNQQLLGASVFFNANAHRLDSWVINNAGTSKTVSLGNASAGTQYLSGGTAGAGLSDTTLATRFNATVNLWVNSNGTDVLTHTVSGRKVD